MTPARTPPAVDAAVEEMVDRTWAALAGPGSFFTGEERIEIARQARIARGLAHDSGSVSTPVAEAARTVAADAHSIRPRTIEQWSDRGVDRSAYVELVSVVVRAVAVDSYRTALGKAVDPLPPPCPGRPDPVVDTAATVSNGWVPTVGPALATTALSSLPRESAAVEGVSDVLYLTYDGVADLKHDPGRSISRPQMELIASRTSWLNRCFY